MASQEIRPIRVEGNIAYIPLTRGYEAIIDVQDVAAVEGVNWLARTGAPQGVPVYAGRAVYSGGKQQIILLHRLLLAPPHGTFVDHINGDGLDNRRCNLRLATKAENARNRRLNVNSASGKKGAWLNKRLNKWQAGIQHNGKQKHLGLFSTAEEAAEAYAKASAELHGAFGSVA